MKHTRFLRVVLAGSAVALGFVSLIVHEPATIITVEPPEIAEPQVHAEEDNVLTRSDSVVSPARLPLGGEEETRVSEGAGRGHVVVGDMYEALLEDSSRDYAHFRFPDGYRCKRYEFDPSSATFKERIRDCLRRREPAIFYSTDEMDFDRGLKWRTRLWTRQYLATTVGDAWVRGKKVKTVSEPLGDLRERKEGFAIRFVDFLDSIKENNSNYYLGIQRSIIEVHQQREDPRQYDATFGGRLPWYRQPPLSALKNDINFPKFYIEATGRQELERVDSYKVNYWMGNLAQPSKSGLHFDVQDNLYFVFAGTKNFTLFTPADGPAFYQNRVSVSHSGVLLGAETNKPNVDVENMNLEQFPMFPFTHRGVCTLQSGEMLLLPSRIFHQVNTLGDSLAINFWPNPHNHEK